MSIAEGRIRRIIREEIGKQIDEMAWAGSLGVRQSRDPSKESFFSDVSQANRGGAERIARSNKFKTLAQKHLANIPHDVWTASIIGVDAEVSDDPDDENRVRIDPLIPDGIAKLKKFGFRSLKRIGSGDTVILYTSMVMERQWMATPWMLFHAMFDSGPSVGQISPSFAKLEDDLHNLRADKFPQFKALMDYEARWSGALTMASARRGGIGTLNDALAEIMCQELLTSGGFRINDGWREAEVVDALYALKPHIKRIAQEFRENIKGKLITVAVN